MLALFLVVRDAHDPADARPAEGDDQDPIVLIRTDPPALCHNPGEPTFRYRSFENTELNTVETEVFEALDQLRPSMIVADIVQDQHIEIMSHHHPPADQFTCT